MIAQMALAVTKRSEEYKKELGEQIVDLEQLFENLQAELAEIARVLDEDDQTTLAKLMGKISVRWDAIWHKLVVAQAIIIANERHEEALVETIKNMGTLYEVRHLMEQKQLLMIEGLARRLDVRSAFDEMIQGMHKIKDMPIMTMEKS